MTSDCPLCGANVGDGTRCTVPALANGRCRAHGGHATGPRTPQGIAAISRAKTKHGRYSIASLIARRMRAGELRHLFSLASPQT